jgi:hypothetical protein
MTTTDNFILKQLIKIANELDRRKLSKEADFLDGIIKKSQIIAPFLQLLSGCSTENEIIPIKGGEPAPGSFDTGGLDTGDSLAWNDLPDCTQKIDWLPEPSDPRWQSGGVPIEEFYIVGRSTSIPVDPSGSPTGDLDSLWLRMDEDGKFITCIWNYVPDSCHYWESEYNVWNFVTDDGQSGMDTIYEAYDKSPLLRVQCHFPVEERDGELYVRLPTDNTGGSVSYNSLDDPCVKEYLAAIGEKVDTGDTGA